MKVNNALQNHKLFKKYTSVFVASPQHEGSNGGNMSHQNICSQMCLPSSHFEGL